MNQQIQNRLNLRLHQSIIFCQLRLFLRPSVLVILVIIGKGVCPRLLSLLSLLYTQILNHHKNQVVLNLTSASNQNFRGLGFVHGLRTPNEYIQCCMLKLLLILLLLLSIPPFLHLFLLKIKFYTILSFSVPCQKVVSQVKKKHSI